MRTQQEIIDRIKSVKEEDYLGFEINTLLPFLKFENAKQFLDDEADINLEKWEEQYYENRSLKEIMIEYMDFAWEKANNKRGISAWRTMCHYKHWLWLDEDNELYKICDNFNYYGKPQLIEICKYLGLDPNYWDDDIREND